MSDGGAAGGGGGRRGPPVLAYRNAAAVGLSRPRHSRLGMASCAAAAVAAGVVYVPAVRGGIADVVPLAGAFFAVLILHLAGIGLGYAGTEPARHPLFGRIGLAANVGGLLALFFCAAPH